MDGELKPTNEIDLERTPSQIVSNPPRPVEKIGVIAGEADKTEYRLHHRLLNEIDEGRESRRVRPIFLLSKYEWLVSWETAMQLHDAWSHREGNFAYRTYNIVTTIENIDAGTLQ